MNHCAPAFQAVEGAAGRRRSRAGVLVASDLGTSCRMSRTSLRNSHHGHEWKGKTSCLTTDMVSANRAALDCADIAGAAYRVLSRATASDAGVTTAILEAVAIAADRCAAECGQHAGHDGHCRVHSEAARRAAELCRAELKTSPLR
jgi:hypothetical protein